MATSLLNMLSAYYSPGIGAFEYYRSIVLTVIISLGTYMGSVRHIRKLHEELKDHLSRTMAEKSDESG